MFSASSGSSQFCELPLEYIKKQENNNKSIAEAKEKEAKWFFEETNGRTIKKSTPIQVYDCGSRVIDDKGDIWTIRQNSQEPWLLKRGMDCHDSGLSGITTEKELELYMQKSRNHAGKPAFPVGPMK